MEIPPKTAALYRHLERHSRRSETAAPLPENFDAILLEEMRRFTTERMAIWEKKTRRATAPLTDDPILRAYRFCNIYRELDRQTIEHHTLLNPLRNDFPLWLLNMFFCRMIARTETVRKTGLLSFEQADNVHIYDALRSLPRPIYGTPYVFPISVLHGTATPTRELFLTNYLPEHIPEIAEFITTLDHSSVYDAVCAILPRFGLRLAFLWTEVLIDVAYQYPEYLDLFKKFPIGPGARPTLTRLAPSLDPADAVVCLGATNTVTTLTYKGFPLPLSAENWEGICCEFRKYTNLGEGHGRRRKYGGE